MNTTTLLSIEKIVEYMNTDLYTYEEHLHQIADNPHYFTQNENANLHYWSDWFNGSDMANY